MFRRRFSLIRVHHKAQKWTCWGRRRSDHGSSCCRSLISVISLLRSGIHKWTWASNELRRWTNEPEVSSPCRRTWTTPVIPGGGRWIDLTVSLAPVLTWTSQTLIIKHYPNKHNWNLSDQFTQLNHQRAPVGAVSYKRIQQSAVCRRERSRWSHAELSLRSAHWGVPRRPALSCAPPSLAWCQTWGWHIVNTWAVWLS